MHTYIHAYIHTCVCMYIKIKFCVCFCLRLCLQHRMVSVYGVSVCLLYYTHTLTNTTYM